MSDKFEDVLVHEPGTWENADGPSKWYAISDTRGIFAYAGDEDTAYIIAKAVVRELRIKKRKENTL
jgi:hypothetical protein